MHHFLMGKGVTTHLGQINRNRSQGFSFFKHMSVHSLMIKRTQAIRKRGAKEVGLCVFWSTS